jgi:diadenosine tetraphosphate (Ap4A) HIT family hydrolase
MVTFIDERVRSANEGTNPTVICRTRSGWAVLGDSQFFSGYTLLLPDPVVYSLNDLSGEMRGQFLMDMAAIGDAILACTDAYRINYEILGNRDQALHAHIFPRRQSESEEFRNSPVWLYPRELRMTQPFDPSGHNSLKKTMRDFLYSVGCAIP